VLKAALFFWKLLLEVTFQHIKGMGTQTE